MVFQSYALWPHMTAAENVAFGLKVRKLPKAERLDRAKAALKDVQLAHLADRKPGELSGGQQQRVALARALVIRPDVLLLDEPLSNLDARLRNDLRDEIRRICKSSGITTVYVTHDQKEALSVADRIAVMRDGDVIQAGTPMNRTAKPRIAPSVEPMDDQRPWQSRDTDESEEVASRQDGPAESQERTQLPPTDTGTDSAPPPDPIALMLGRLETEMQDPERALAATFLAQAIRDYVDADDGSRPSQNLSPPERELAELLGPLLDALTTGDRADAPNRIGVAIDDAARGLASVLPVRINDAALATDIYGFAAYRPFESYVFLAGRSNRMLVYTEPANFESRLATEPTSQGGAPNPGAYEVVLGLELQLYNERGSMVDPLAAEWGGRGAVTAEFAGRGRRTDRGSGQRLARFQSTTKQPRTQGFLRGGVSMFWLVRSGLTRSRCRTGSGSTGNRRS